MRRRNSSAAQKQACAHIIMTHSPLRPVGRRWRSPTGRWAGGREHRDAHDLKKHARTEVLLLLVGLDRHVAGLICLGILLHHLRFLLLLRSAKRARASVPCANRVRNGAVGRPPGSGATPLQNTARRNASTCLRSATNLAVWRRLAVHVHAVRHCGECWWPCTREGAAGQVTVGGPFCCY